MNRTTNLADEPAEFRVPIIRTPRNEYGLTLAEVASITAFIVIMAVVCPLAFHFGYSIDWKSPAIGQLVGWTGLMASVIGTIIYLSRR